MAKKESGSLTNKQVLDVADSMHYHFFNMLNFNYILCFYKQIPQVCKNALLESFLLHLRSFLNFFDPNYKAHKDYEESIDADITDFFSSHSQEYKEMVNEFNKQWRGTNIDKLRKKINRQVAHLVGWKDRRKYPAKRHWDTNKYFTKMCPIIGKWLLLILDTNPQLLSKRWKKYFKKKESIEILKIYLPIVLNSNNKMYKKYFLK